MLVEGHGRSQKEERLVVDQQIDNLKTILKDQIEEEPGKKGAKRICIDHSDYLEILQWIKMRKNQKILQKNLDKSDFWAGKRGGARSMRISQRQL